MFPSKTSWMLSRVGTVNTPPSVTPLYPEIVGEEYSWTLIISPFLQSPKSLLFTIRIF